MCCVHSRVAIERDLMKTFELLAALMQPGNAMNENIVNVELFEDESESNGPFGFEYADEAWNFPPQPQCKY